MRVAAILRGFPGLGRIMPGLSLLTQLQEDYGCECILYTYGQGLSVAAQSSLPMPLDLCPEHADLTAIGLNPVTRNGAAILNFIIRAKPDKILLDGEPLVTRALSLCVPPDNIISLLNPHDIENEHLPYSTLRYFQDCFLSGSKAIVHGLQVRQGLVRKAGCSILYIPTILRPCILKLKNSPRRGDLVLCILGGGVLNSSSSFFQSTAAMGKLILAAASYFMEYKFIICSNSQEVSSLLKSESVPGNVYIQEGFADMEHFYPQTAAAICRGGRNTISELLYLNIPAILIPCEDDYRKVEQSSNIQELSRKFPRQMRKARIPLPPAIFASILAELLESPPFVTNFNPGNSRALEFILN